MHHDSCFITTFSQHCIQFFLISYTACAIINHHLTFQSCWTNILAIVLHYMVAHLVYALGRSEESLNLGTASQLVFLFFTQIVFASHLVEGFLQSFFIQMHLHRYFSEVQLQRCTIIDRVLEGILRHISSIILISTKALKCVLIALINRRTSQSKEECIW